MGDNAIAQLLGISTGIGQTDHFSLNQTSDLLSFVSGVTKSVTSDLTVNVIPGVARDAQVTSMATAGDSESLQFMGTGDNQMMFLNTGGAGIFSMTFSEVVGGAVKTFSTGRMMMAAGDTLDLTPSDWQNLTTATAAAVFHHKNGTTTTMNLLNVGVGTNLAAKEAVAVTGIVATFSKITETGLSAIIDWGDGTATTPGVITLLSGGKLTVSGTHTYGKQGYFITSIRLLDASGLIGRAGGLATVTDTSFKAKGSAISAFAGVGFSGVVATVTDVPSGDVATDFVVSIKWGDGATSAGTLQSTGTGTFNVLGSHTYAKTGTDFVSITIIEVGTAAGKVYPLTIGSSKTFSGNLATLQIPLPGTAAAAYLATINWGDGKTSVGKLVLSGNILTLSGSHTYSAAGKYTPTFTLTGGRTATVTTTATVHPAVGTIKGIAFDDANGDGILDDGEKVLANQKLFLDANNNGIRDGSELTAVTNSLGQYVFSNVPIGNYRIFQAPTPNWRVDSPSGGFIPVTVAPGQTSTVADLAITQLALISGTVFNDANANKLMDSTRTWIARLDGLY
jgi:hypothetical protein